MRQNTENALTEAVAVAVAEVGAQVWDNDDDDNCLPSPLCCVFDNHGHE